MTITAAELAAGLNGVEYPADRNISSQLIDQAKAAGLVIVYGASDDLMEFDGAIRDELDAYDGTTAMVDTDGLLPNRDDIDDDREMERYFQRRNRAVTIEAEWAPGDEPGLSWRYKTDIPHHTFDVMEDGELYCRGIVFALADACVQRGDGEETEPVPTRQEWSTEPGQWEVAQLTTDAPYFTIWDQGTGIAKVFKEEHAREIVAAHNLAVAPAGKSRFAKLFEHAERGQFLVKLDTNDEGNPEVRVFCEPANLGVCSVALGFYENDDGWDSAEKAFSDFDLEKCLRMTQIIFNASGAQPTASAPDERPEDQPAT